MAGSERYPFPLRPRVFCVAYEKEINRGPAHARTNERKKQRKERKEGRKEGINEGRKERKFNKEGRKERKKTNKNDTLPPRTHLSRQAISSPSPPSFTFSQEDLCPVLSFPRLPPLDTKIEKYRRIFSRAEKEETILYT